MEIKKFMALNISLDEGVDLTNYIAVIHLMNENNVQKIKELFDKHNYNLRVIPANFLKIFTMNEKEIFELEKVLDRIDELEMQKIFNANLKPAVFKASMLSKVELCLTKKVPFINSDNTFVSAMVNDDILKKYINTHSLSDEINLNPPRYMDGEIPPLLDAEDLMVKSEIIKRLTEINQMNPEDTTLTFIISSAIANLDDLIAEDAKNYREIGPKHIVEKAMYNIALTPEMQNIVDSKVLSAFINNNEMINRGV